jgi:hypothetical protein
MGLLQGTLIHVGTNFLRFMEQLQADHGTSSPLVAGVGLSVVAVFGGMLVVSIMILAILSTPREKYD